MPIVYIYFLPFQKFIYGPISNHPIILEHLFFITIFTFVFHFIIFQPFGKGHNWRKQNWVLEAAWQASNQDCHVVVSLLFNTNRENVARLSTLVSASTIYSVNYLRGAVSLTLFLTHKIDWAASHSSRIHSLLPRSPDYYIPFSSHHFISLEGPGHIGHWPFMIF